MSTWADFLDRAQRAHKDKFDAGELWPQFIPYYNSGERIEVTTTYQSGNTWTRRGTVGVTTGWRPAFLLMHRRGQIGSFDVLGQDDKVTARIIRGKRVPV